MTEDNDNNDKSDVNGGKDIFHGDRKNKAEQLSGGPHTDNAPRACEQGKARTDHARLLLLDLELVAELAKCWCMAAKSGRRCVGRV